MKYYIISGEASGDLHASNLIKAIKINDTQAQFRCWGGDLMLAQGVTLVKHYKDLAFMGFTEVILNLRTILSNIRFCKSDILFDKPDVIILVDYPGFNLRIAEFAKQNNIKVVYYISPQIWAWKQSRVHKIKRCVDLMLVILPFEKDFYKKFNYDVKFVGHPLLDAIKNYKDNKIAIIDFKKKYQIAPEKKIVALLPGSRKQEVEIILPLMLSVQNEFSNLQFVVGVAPSLTDEFISTFTKDKNTICVRNETYSLLNFADAALVTSGTATLETALFNVPEVVCYKGGKISYLIARALIKVKYISLVNLIMDRETVKELVQGDLTAKSIAQELHLLLYDDDKRKQIYNDYELLRVKCGSTGASINAANEINLLLHKN